MTIRDLAIATGVAAAAVLAVVVVPSATADRSLTLQVSSSQSDLEYVEIRKTSPGNWAARVCGVARLADGKLAHLPEGNCDECNLGAVAGLGGRLQACLAAWKSNRGL